MNKKEQLLQDIAELFYKRGYDKTSIRDISRALNLSKPGIYHHFASKQEILFDIIYDFMEKTNRHLMENMALIQSPEERLLFIVQSHTRFFVKYPAQTKVVVYEAHSLEGDFAARFKEKQIEYITIIKKVVQEIIKETGSKMDVNVVTFSLLGILNWTIQWYKPEGKVPPEMLAKQIWDFFLNGLRGHGSGLDRWETGE
jgi:AcrR family transcriptional regulator